MKWPWRLASDGRGQRHVSVEDHYPTDVSCLIVETKQKCKLWTKRRLHSTPPPLAPHIAPLPQLSYDQTTMQKHSTELPVLSGVVGPRIGGQ